MRAFRLWTLEGSLVRIHICLQTCTFAHMCMVFLNVYGGLLMYLRICCVMEVVGFGSVRSHRNLKMVHRSPLRPNTSSQFQFLYTRNHSHWGAFPTHSCLMKRRVMCLGHHVTGMVGLKIQMEPQLSHKL